MELCEVKSVGGQVIVYHIAAHCACGCGMQEKQIRGKQAMKQLSDKMRDQRVQVADRVRKHVAAARILPKVVRPSWICCISCSKHSVIASGAMGREFGRENQILCTILCPLCGTIPCSYGTACSCRNEQEVAAIVPHGIAAGHGEECEGVCSWC